MLQYPQRRKGLVEGKEIVAGSAGRELISPANKGDTKPSGLTRNSGSEQSLEGIKGC